LDYWTDGRCRRKLHHEDQGEQAFRLKTEMGNLAEGFNMEIMKS
jgi:hypothetical protein